jgi:ferredoxin
VCSSDLPDAAASRQVVFGLKSCDVHAMRVHRRVLLDGEFADPFYAARAAATLLVAADCPEPAGSCFCNLAGLLPHVGERADLAVSVVADGLLVEALTEAGEELLQPAELFHAATEAQLAERERSRAAAVAKLAAANPEPWKETLPAAIAARMGDEQFWRRHAATCVECFGCLMACPTCYCFLLCDLAEAGTVRRSRVWDACYEAAYTRVGGGANPRGEFLKRFANRFECKYKEFHNDHGFFACSGCGRCVGVCMGRIDVRRVLEEA